MSKDPETFMETLEHRRFTEFCDACRRYRYIGLCYGPSGVGKTLSARKYSCWNEIEGGPQPHQLLDEQLSVTVRWRTVFYTVPVINAPRQVEAEVLKRSQRLQSFAEEPLRREEAAGMAKLQAQSDTRRRAFLDSHDWLREPCPERVGPPYAEIAREYTKKRQALGTVAGLILVDEADRLKMPSLEQLRDLFDRTPLGLVLIGMPGLEKRLARYPQFYSRIGFVHEFRPLSVAQIRELLARRWLPPGVTLPADGPLEEETVAAIVRVTGGNFRLFHRLLTQIERILEINSLPRVTAAVVEAARESLVIGQV